MYSIVPAVLREIHGNQFQDGGRGGHIENRNTAVFERNLPLTPNTHTKNLLIRQAVRSPRNRRELYWTDAATT
jgi:hypothetical protein